MTNNNSTIEASIVGRSIAGLISQGINVTISGSGTPLDPYIVNSSAGSTPPTVVANYSALPVITTVSGKFYWVSNSQGTNWLPGSLGGTFYNSGLYYSNGTTWEFLNVPFQATQIEVNGGIENTRFMTSFTYQNSDQLIKLRQKALLYSVSF